MPRKYTPQERIQAFWNKIIITADDNQCWLWIASSHKQGYGWFGTELAHRIAWSYPDYLIPDGLCILHSCDNPKCCNPKHLFLGTQLENIQDKVNKNRQSKISGEKHHSCRISDKQIEEIRERYAKGGVLYKTIAQDMGIAIGTVGRFVTGKHTKRIKN